ncbi:hypothetical protein DXG01_005203 [Tephrocybe rancida]|nr:hypothetical protein DXG01_005203 [Tephrocybe rancida]
MRYLYSLLALLCIPAALGRAAEAEQHLQPSSHSQASSHSNNNNNNDNNNSNDKKDATKIVLTNDDGWANAQIRSEYAALKQAGYELLLWTSQALGSSTANPVVLTVPCEFNSCPIGSPAVGYNASDHHINYVNAFPVDAVRYGIQTLSPKLLGSKPDLVFSGINIGISYTTLESNPKANSSIAAGIYSKLSLKFLRQLLDNPGPILPANVSLNVNFPAIENCTSPEHFKFVFTRIYASTNATNVRTCGSAILPDETTVVTAPGCHAAVSVFSALTKDDVSASTQAVVLKKLQPLLSCF